MLCVKIRKANIKGNFPFYNLRFLIANIYESEVKKGTFLTALYSFVIYINNNFTNLEHFYINYLHLHLHNQ